MWLDGNDCEVIIKWNKRELYRGSLTYLSETSWPDNVWLKYFYDPGLDLDDKPLPRRYCYLIVMPTIQPC